MLKTRVIPCMLFNGYSLVKTIQFGQMRNLGNPVQMARVYNSRVVDELVFIDLAASAEKREPLYDLIGEVIQECFVPITIGGGVHSLDTIKKLLDIGADKVAVNSEALSNPDFITEASRRFGAQCIVISIDCKKAGSDYAVCADRGTRNTGKTAASWASEVERRGAGEIFLTSIDADGVMEGYDLELVRSVSDAVSIPVIAHGGAGKVQDIIDVIQKTGAHAASLASMFHYSGHTPNSIKRRMRDAGIAVRIVDSDRS